MVFKAIPGYLLTILNGSGDSRGCDRAGHLDFLFVPSRTVIRFIGHENCAVADSKGLLALADQLAVRQPCGDGTVEYSADLNREEKCYLPIVFRC